MALSLSEVLTFDPHEEMFSPLPFVLLRKRKLREVTSLSKGHVVSGWENLSLSPDLSES